MSEETKYELVKFIDNELELEVSVSPKEEKIWMSQEQIVKLFNTSKQNISLHISNILKSGELEYSTVKENLTVQYEGERKIKYNLEMIISVGYRVKSKRRIMFGKDRKTITRHIQNILKEFELKEKQVCSKNEHTALAGKKYIVKIYNLEMIIAIGYRVKSKRAILFRQWANKVLKEYLLKGYVINDTRSSRRVNYSKI